MRQRKSLKRRAVLREERLGGKASEAAKEDSAVMEESEGAAQTICCRGRRAARLRYAKVRDAAWSSLFAHSGMAPTDFFYAMYVMRCYQVRQLWEGRIVGEANDCSWLSSQSILT